MKYFIFLLVVIVGYSCEKKKHSKEETLDHRLISWGANDEISSPFLKGIPKRDSDKDGIIDAYDKCPKQKETVNGYQDSDGCPDTAPTPAPTPTYPASYRLTMPPVINQGSEGSCLPMTVGYYSLSAEVFYRTGATSYSYTTNVFSPEYMYNNISLQEAGCSGGTAMIENYNYLINNGVILFSEAPYSWSNGCNDIVSNAVKQKISSYQVIQPTDRLAMKQAIVDKHPLGFVFTADRDWYYGNGSSNYVWKGPYSSEIYGGHGCSVVGWDDAKNAWLTINSFGTAWGDAGYRWIDYDWFAYITTRCYRIVL